MTPGEVYGYIAGHNLTFNFGGVIPSHGLPLLGDAPLCDLNGQCFLIFLPHHDAYDGHYIALLCQNTFWELFDPLGGVMKDPYVRAFMRSNACVINTAPCQSPSMVTCGLYCLYYAYLRSIGFARHDIVDLLTICTLYTLSLSVE